MQLQETERQARGGHLRLRGRARQRRRRAGKGGRKPASVSSCLRQPHLAGAQIHVVFVYRLRQVAERMTGQGMVCFAVL